jgi:hypothetical protein
LCRDLIAVKKCASHGFHVEINILLTKLTHKGR